MEQELPLPTEQAQTPTTAAAARPQQKQRGIAAMLAGAVDDDDDGGGQTVNGRSVRQKKTPVPYCIQTRWSS